MWFDDTLHDFQVYLTSNKGLSEHTVSAYVSDIRQCLNELSEQGIGDLNDVDVSDLRAWMARTAEHHARSSLARKTVAVRNFFAWGYDHGIIDSDRAQ